MNRLRPEPDIRCRAAARPDVLDIPRPASRRVHDLARPSRPTPSSPSAHMAPGHHPTASALVRNFSNHEQQTHRSARLGRREPMIVSHVRFYAASGSAASPSSRANAGLCLRTSTTRSPGRFTPFLLRFPADPQVSSIALLRHQKTQVWIEDSSRPADEPREAEAARFSRDVLVPSAAVRELAMPNTDAAVREFAARIGVAPGIVMGRLQHDGYWPYSRGNDLKRRLELADTESSSGAGGGKQYEPLRRDDHQGVCSHREHLRDGWTTGGVRLRIGAVLEAAVRDDTQPAAAVAVVEATLRFFSSHFGPVSPRVEVKLLEDALSNEAHAIELQREIGAHHELGKAHAALAVAHLRCGELDQAEAALHSVVFLWLPVPAACASWNPCAPGRTLNSPVSTPIWKPSAFSRGRYPDRTSSARMLAYPARSKSTLSVPSRWSASISERLSCRYRSNFPSLAAWTNVFHAARVNSSTGP